MQIANHISQPVGKDFNTDSTWLQMATDCSVNLLLLCKYHNKNTCLKKK